MSAPIQDTSKFLAPPAEQSQRGLHLVRRLDQRSRVRFVRSRIPFHQSQPLSVGAGAPWSR